ncbi:hypothetical protein SDC9_131372 [bioreactor metagenome]|uniref:Polyphenol oxidase n=1 Tax=bioreactor metagenome TaxID=1076179 RepID=A0A645D505_9ZZZZ
MKKDCIEGFEYLTYSCGENIEVVFFTAGNGLTFNRRTEKGQESLNSIKRWFNVKEVVYLNQIHSDIIHIFSNNADIINSEGDGIITNNRETAIGVFTADCVPVIIVDKTKKVIGAVHSGWKGTYANIAGKAVEEMKETFGCNPEDLSIYIGPHNRSCCYEVSEELIQKFHTNPIFKDKVKSKEFKINEGRKLDLETCIKIQLLSYGIKEENINSTEECTFCSKNFKLFSYRREDEKEGRMYSFVYIR